MGKSPNNWEFNANGQASANGNVLYSLVFWAWKSTSKQNSDQAFETLQGIILATQGNEATQRN